MDAAGRENRAIYKYILVTRQQRILAVHSIKCKRLSFGATNGFFQTRLTKHKCPSLSLDLACFKILVALNSESMYVAPSMGTETRNFGIKRAIRVKLPQDDDHKADVYSVSP